MRKRAPIAKTERETVQVALRLAPSEADVMRRLIERAERLAHLPPGTLTMASFSRGAVLDYMGRELARMEEEPKAETPTGPSVWERVRRAHEFFPDPGTTKKGSKS